MIRPKTYLLLERSIREGIERGLLRIGELDQPPSITEQAYKLTEEVMLEVNEWFEFREDEQP